MRNPIGLRQLSARRIPHTPLPPVASPPEQTTFRLKTPALRVCSRLHGQNELACIWRNDKRLLLEIRNRARRSTPANNSITIASTVLSSAATWTRYIEPPISAKPDRAVAIKLPHPQMDGDEVIFAERFQREQEIGQPSRSSRHSQGHPPGTPSQNYMVMEWVDGKLLRQILAEEKKLSQERAVKIAFRHLPGAQLHPQPRHRPSRSQARARDGRRGKSREADRLRSRGANRRAANHLHKVVPVNRAPPNTFLPNKCRESAATPAATSTPWE